MRNAKCLFGFLLGMALLWGCGAAHAATPAISAGADHTIGLKTDGTVLSWGSDSSGQLGVGRLMRSSNPVLSTGISGLKAITTGTSHTVALKGDGSVWAWGDNWHGQLGDGTTTGRSIPVQVSGLTGVVAISAGQDHTVALKSDGSVWTWGGNGNSALGDGTTTDRSTSAPVSGLTGVVAISAGDYHTVALKDDGSVWTWGMNRAGQLGDGTTTNRPTPAPVNGLTGVVAISAGRDHTVALKGDGSVWALGDNKKCQLGDGTTIDRSTPAPVSGLTGAVAISAGSDHTVALKADGSVWAWGWGGLGQLGVVPSGDRSTPVKVIGLTGVVAISAAYLHTAALKDDGSVWAWGHNNVGQLGDGTTIDRRTPVKVIGLTGVVAISAGDQYTVALKGNGSVLSWGDNGSGQFGDGTTTVRSIPAQVGGLTGVAAISAGRSYTVALKGDGSVWAWGSNGNGPLSDNMSTPAPVNGLTGVAAISAGENHTIALKGDGSVWTWFDPGTYVVMGNAGGRARTLRYNGYGELGNGKSTTLSVPVPVQVSSLTNVVAASAGGSHSVALKADGSVWAWGDNQFGQIGNGSTSPRLLPIPGPFPVAVPVPVQVGGLTGVVAISAGALHTVALKGDGSVWAWGYNSSGQLGDGTMTDRSTPVQVSGLTGVVAISAGDYYTVALKGDGSVWAWGYNEYGQLGDGTTNYGQRTPVQVSRLTDVVAISAGWKHTVALKSDGSVAAWGYNLSGQLGDGTLAQRLSPVLVVNPSVDGFLNLYSGTTVNVPPELQVPFFAVASGEISATSATVSTTTKFNAADLGKSGAVYVTAMVPSGSLVAQQAMSRSKAFVATALAAPAANTFVQIQLTPTGWQQVIGGQLIPLASGVLGELLAAQTILNSQDTTNLKGAQFCVGYGTSAAEMIATGKMRVVATIPTDPGATVAVSCVITGSGGATGFIVEFYKADINHYFMTASSDEAAFLDSKPSWNWARTGKAFNVWLAQASAPGNASPVCRFFGVFANGTVGSHFYTVDPDECEYVKGRLDWGWGYEGDAFYAVKPAGSSCPTGTAPVYRVFNNGMGGAPNHRYMASQTDVDAMVSQGWVAEGTAFCGAQ